MSITVVGLGPGSPGMITREAWDSLAAAGTVYLRTKVHPTVAHLPKDLILESFDSLYEESADFAAVYSLIVEKLTELGANDDIVYAVPGDPTIAEGTVTRLRVVCEVKGIPFRIVHGVSFIEPTLAVIGIDGTDGLQILDALDIISLHHPNISPDRSALIAQLYSKQTASDVKLTLMNQYPDDHEVLLIQNAGMPDQDFHRLPLFEIDRVVTDHLTSLYVPARAAESVSSFEGFQETIAYLRAPEGCPWDREQTHQSLRSYLVEETYEVIDALDEGDPQELCEELGDLLLQIVLHTQIAIDDGEFDMCDVIQHIDTKIKRRHPHVWGDVDVHGSPDEVAKNWEHIKAQERQLKVNSNVGILDGVPKSLPALGLAYEYDRRASRAGFDWLNIEGVVEKVNEELAEVLDAVTKEDKEREIGDLLLSVAVLARWMKVSPEDSLRTACNQFYRRFVHLESSVRESSRSIKDVTHQELEALWHRAKDATAK